MAPDKQIDMTNPKNMTATTIRSTQPPPSARSAMKSAPAATAAATSIPPAQPQSAAHSHTQIAQKAYEI